MIAGFRFLIQQSRTHRSCEHCRHSCRWKADLVCLKRLVQRCRNDGSLHRLEMAPGICSVLNPDHECPVFQPTIRVLLREKIGNGMLFVYLLFAGCVCRRSSEQRNTTLD